MDSDSCGRSLLHWCFHFPLSIITKCFHYISGVVKESTAGPSRKKFTKLRSRAYNVIQQDPFGSDQDEWDWSDLSLGCKTPAADRCPMPRFVNSYAREWMNCDIAHCSIPDSKSIKDFKGEEIGGHIPYILLPRDDCTLHHSSTTKWRFFLLY